MICSLMFVCVAYFVNRFLLDLISHYRTLVVRSDAIGQLGITCPYEGVRAFVRACVRACVGACVRQGWVGRCVSECVSG